MAIKLWERFKTKNPPNRFCGTPACRPVPMAGAVVACHSVQWRGGPEASPAGAVFQISSLSRKAPCCSPRTPSGELSEVRSAFRGVFLLSLPQACGDGSATSLSIE